MKLSNSHLIEASMTVMLSGVLEQILVLYPFLINYASIWYSN